LSERNIIRVKLNSYPFRLLPFLLWFFLRHWQGIMREYIDKYPCVRDCLITCISSRRIIIVNNHIVIIFIINIWRKKIMFLYFFLYMCTTMNKVRIVKTVGSCNRRNWFLFLDELWVIPDEKHPVWQNIWHIGKLFIFSFLSN
jgi:hypothetical protein